LAPPLPSLAPLVPSLAPRTPRWLLAAPVVVGAVVAVACLVGGRTRPTPVAERTPAPASRPIVTQLPAPIDEILPARFGFNERTPLGEAREIAAIVARCGSGPVVLTGHADALGSTRANDEIALARADAVRALLAAEGVDAARVRIVSAGATQPIASNASARGRRDNRRVTLHCEPHNGGEP
jgi:outer membrane protein OmpA-like peptidoglycan-associated protein